MIEFLHQRTQEYELKRVDYEKQISNLTDQISRTQNEKCGLDSYNKKLIDEVDTLTARSIQLEEQLCLLKNKEEELKEQNDTLRIRKEEKDSEVSSLQKQLKEQLHMLKEYQEKVAYYSWKFFLV